MLVRHYFRTNGSVYNPHMQYAQAQKPKPTGLWVAKEDAWIEWGVQNSFDHWTRDFVELDLDLSDIYKIRFERDLDALREEYGVVHEELNYVHSIDWSLVAREFKGVYALNWEYGWSGLDSLNPWFYGWDLASGCVWDLSALEEIKDVSH